MKNSTYTVSVERDVLVEQDVHLRSVVGKEIYKLKDIQRYCKTKVLAQPIPSLSDVTDVKAEKILDQVNEIIENVELTKMIEIIEKKVNEQEYTTLELAAAFLKLNMGDTNEEIVVEPQRQRNYRDNKSNRGMVRLFINIGKKQNIRPGDILGAIAGETGMAGRLIGTIDVYDKYTFVEVPKEYSEDVINVMKDAKIKGKTINVEVANKR